MKSKICLCNGAVLKKDLTRFAPLMLGTGLFLAMVGWSVSMTYDLAYEELGATSFGIEPVQIFLMFTQLLGLISALCFFGYLTKKRECDAMHALPVRRETFFLTHCLAALIQFAVPFGILYAFLPGNRGWGFQMGFTFCGWLFFFGLAVFSMMLSGRRLGGLMIFWLLSDLVSSLWSMVATLYIPQLPGLYLDSETALTLTPTTHMATLDFKESSFGELLPMGLYALGGVVLLAIALVIYRRRKLERAGDFLAERWLEPVFAWGLGISAACIFVSLGYMMEATVWFPLILGLAVGYFAARMLFARSVKVFHKGSLVSFAALVAVMAASVFLVSTDPLGAVKKVPELAQIESVSVMDSAYIYGYGTGLTTTDPEHISEIRDIHLEMVEQEELSNYQAMDELFLSADNDYYLIYTMTDGSELKRHYRIEDGDHLDRIEYLISQPEHLVGTASLEELLSSASDLYAYDLDVDGGMIHTRRSFFQVFLADCEAGNMYTCDYNEESTWTVTMTINLNGESQNLSIYVPYAAVDTIAWLEDYFH